MILNGGIISDNQITNPGQSRSEFHDSFRVGIFLDGKLENLKIRNNSFIDNQEVNTLKSGIINFNACSSGCEVKDNSLQIYSDENVEMMRNADG